MESDTSTDQPSRRKVLRKQALEIKALKDEWKKALIECKKKGSKKEVDKEYKTKLEALELTHKMDLMNLSGNSEIENISNSPITSNENNFYFYTEENPSIYTNSKEIISKSEKRRKKKQKELEFKHSKLVEEYSLNSKLLNSY